MPRRLGLTSLQILAAVRDGATYGLDIVAHAGVASGTVYTTLGRLTRKGLVRSRWEDPCIAEEEGRPRRRYYELTEEGASVLAEAAGRIQALAATLDPDVAPGAG